MKYISNYFKDWNLFEKLYLFVGISCEQYSICKSGCIGQKIIANYTESDNKVLTLKRCINLRNPKCMR